MKTEIPADEPETFRQYLARKLLPYKAARPKLAWDKENRGQGIFPGKNAEKRQRRAAHAMDRLAQIRAFRRGAVPDGLGASDHHVPKLKHVPADVFE